MSMHHIHIDWAGTGLQFTGHNPGGTTVAIDGDSRHGTSPMVLLLHAIAGCTGSDVVSLLEKMRQPVTTLRIEVEAAKRSEGDYPRVWEQIRIRYIVGGAVERDKAEKAVELSMEKYCSVSAMLGKTAEISHELVLLG